MKRRISKYVVLTPLLLALILNYCQMKVEAPTRVNEKIVFLSNRDAPKRQFDIFSVNMDGSSPVNLTGNIEGVRSISNPVVSPDGKEILFIAFKDGGRFLQKMNIDGTKPKILTEIRTDSPNTHYSPDGSRIVYVDKIKQRHQIYIIDRDGSSRMNLSNGICDEFEPAFSPDGSKIVYISICSNAYSICMINSDGSKKKVMLEDTVEMEDPHFSPDGSRILFSSFLDGDSDIYIMRKSGRSLEKVFDSPSYETEPIFSPNGQYILCLSDRRGMKYRDLFLHDLKSRNTVNLTMKLDYINQNASFTTDGKTIVFESVKYEDSEIYAVDITGENMINLTNHPKWDCGADL